MDSVFDGVVLYSTSVKIALFSAMVPWHALSSYLAKSAVSGHAQYKRLYLPESWTKDKARMEQCGVPKEVEFQTKAQLGLEMIREAQKREMPYSIAAE